jgi:DNA-binding NarL/FixJ family response regulator
MKCRVLVADDHELVRCGVRALLQTHTDMEVCGESADGRDAVRKARELKPDLIIIDIGMPRMNGIIACSRILADEPRQKILMFPSVESETTIRSAMELGIRGLIFKTDPVSDLAEAIEAVRQGRTFFSRQVDQIILAGYLEAVRENGIKRNHFQNPLSIRESEVIQLVVEGKSSKEVAVMLGVSTKTAETHRTRIMRKLGIHDLAGLVIYAIRQNIIEAPAAYDLSASAKNSAAAVATS